MMKINIRSNVRLSNSEVKLQKSTAIVMQLSNPNTEANRFKYAITQYNYISQEFPIHNYKVHQSKSRTTITVITGSQKCNYATV